ncbi:hypothetical protein [Liquorilactobacillus satsumensis]|nr:hypothetical protein [Liquorilactobacillus satsumensis]MCC7666679.1 hypothetical protein [Liquorilactobacillus satsumensis]MCP9312701.1 hypothetical protein [Liquorilactobacillus satsumensis]MCP9327520.1 hypothetical protein [Liquorilactobacillus satsumensis]MCP9357556.1 hypothetical protein [Liquorilactobacillus satsumensis]MCP9359887.1 hypothetical protein [Liquorilactobacillus satsumensis]
MFLTTGEINQSYMILGVVNATLKRTLTAEQIDEVDCYEELYTQVKTKLIEKAVAKNGDGIIGVHFVPQIVNVVVGPKYVMLHGYGTVISLPHRK